MSSPLARPAASDRADQDPPGPVAEPASEWPTETDFRQEFFACLALRHTPGIGPRTAKAIVSHYSTAYAAIRDASAWKGLGLASKRQAEAFRAEAWRPMAEREYRDARAVSMRVLLFSESIYPPRLWDIPDPPLFLYYEGDLSLLKAPCLAVVGSRKCSPMGVAATENICATLSRSGVTIVSGLALGIDRQAHLAGLSGLGRSIAVMATGLHVDYPPQNADLRRALGSRGLVLTEHPPGTRPLSTNFPIRNRIISGLSLGALVAEAGPRSGSLITARLALEQGRDVFALPGPYGQPSFSGCNQLIKNGALLVESADDIFLALREQLRGLAALIAPGKPSAPASAASPALAPTLSPVDPVSQAAPQAARIPKPLPPDLDPSGPEGRLLGLLAGSERLHIDTLAERLDWEAGAASRVLLLLEMRGLVRQWPGMYYSRD